jgi:ubiquinol-cytochrome c reductase iron-sulfur subunit
LQPGERISVEWRGKAIYIVNRTQPMLDTLKTLDDRLRDPSSEESEQPSYAKNSLRSLKPEYLVVTGVCTHLGCAPLSRFEPADATLGADWPGGFFCPCHGSKFDLAGRVFTGVPAPSNLLVPPHRYVNDSTLLIGSDSGNS